VIHALSGEQDIRKMGGLRGKIPVTFWTFAIATAAIAGLPPLSGFFSKDEILWFAFASDRGGSAGVFALAALTALMTAFYMFRLLWLVFFGTSRLTPHAAAHVHESPLSMTGVLAILAVLSAIGGFLSIPHFLEPMLPLPGIQPSRAGAHVPIVVMSVALGLAGLAGAAWFYAGKGERAEAVRARFSGLHRLLSGKYFVDEFYDLVINRPLLWVSEHVFLRLSDRALIDGTLNGLAALAQRTSGVMGRLQTGHLHLYVLLALIGTLAVLFWGWRHA
jgi:NADH-quinone oxidoreductase subunit L